MSKMLQYKNPEQTEQVAGGRWQVTGGAELADLQLSTFHLRPATLPKLATWQIFIRLLLVALVIVLAACGGDSDTGSGGGNAQALLVSGQSALDSGNYDQAINDFLAVNKISPNLDAYFGLGNAYTRLNRLSDALAAYQSALEINPNHTATLSNLGVAQYQLGQLNDAVGTFKKALTLSPGDAETHYLLGATYIQLGDMTAAEASLQKALDLAPSLPEAHFGMGILLRMQGQTAEAIAEFEAFLNGPPAQDPRARSEAEKILQELRGQ